jgi:hypothetical protein
MLETAIQSRRRRLAATLEPDCPGMDKLTMALENLLVDHIILYSQNADVYEPLGALFKSNCIQRELLGIHGLPAYYHRATGKVGGDVIHMHLFQWGDATHPSRRFSTLLAGLHARAARKKYNRSGCLGRWWSAMCK